MEQQKITGSEALLKALIAEGVDTIFGYPGGQAIPIYDKLYDYQDQLRHVLVRHEQGATHAAQGYARVSGRVGVALVTSGPGATNTITGIADAMMDSTPMVVIAGQVPSPLLGTDAFQEIDVIGITQPITKWAYQIRKPEEVAWAVSRAFYIASSGRPGPVVLDFAKDAQVGLVDYHYEKVDYIRSYQPEPEIKMSRIEEAAALINAAQKPFCLIGQGVILGGAEAEIRQFLEKNDIPSGSTTLGLSALPTDHPLNKGMLGMHGNVGPNRKTNECDVLIAVGMRFDDRVTGNLQTYAKQAKIIHLDIDNSEIGKNVPVDVKVLGNAKHTLPLITERLESRKRPEWNAAFEPDAAEEQEKVIEKELHPKSGYLRMGEVIRKVSEATGHDAVLVTDVGQNQMWATQYLELDEKHQMITSGGLGTMGFGFPAAIGAKIGNRDKTVVCVTGDGGFQMNMQEMATTVVQEAPVIVCLLNNQYLGMVRQMQQLFYGKRYEATCLRRRRSCPKNCKGPSDACPPYEPDFVKWAESYGAHGIRVEKAEEIEAALQQAKTYTDAPTVIEFLISSEEIVLPMVKGGNPMSEMILK